MDHLLFGFFVRMLENQQKMLEMMADQQRRLIELEKVSHKQITEEDLAERVRKFPNTTMPRKLCAGPIDFSKTQTFC